MSSLSPAPLRSSLKDPNLVGLTSSAVRSSEVAHALLATYATAERRRGSYRRRRVDRAGGRRWLGVYNSAKRQGLSSGSVPLIRVARSRLRTEAIALLIVERTNRCASALYSATPRIAPGAEGHGMDRGEQGRCLFAAEGFKSRVEATGVVDPSTGPAGCSSAILEAHYTHDRRPGSSGRQEPTTGDPPACRASTGTDNGQHPLMGLLRSAVALIRC